MNCLEFREQVHQNMGLDSLLSQEMKHHLIICPACRDLLDNTKFWDAAVLALLDREAPEGLRQEILGGHSEKTGSGGPSWRKKNLKIWMWALTRNEASWVQWLEVIAFVVGVIWLLPKIFSWWGVSH